MKKIGKEVLFMTANESNPRLGEGAFIRLKNNAILYIYTKYMGTDWNDHANADLYGVYSYDEGETWGNDRLILKKDNEAKNYMSVSLLRMNDDSVGLFYLRKDNEGNCRLCLARSYDECQTWTESICCIKEEGYFVTNNDRVIKLKNGKILFPANYHKMINKKEVQFDEHGSMVVFSSSDDGNTWSKISEKVEFPVSDISRTNLQETGLYERQNGTLIAWSRTDLAFQYECFSYDEGKTWTIPKPNKYFSSPVSPMQIKKVNEYTVAVFNPIPHYITKDEEKTWGRTPYVCAVSIDDGKTFEKVYYIEDDLKNGYCYPAVITCKDGLIIAYYHSNNSGVCLNSTKITKVYFSEFDF